MIQKIGTLGQAGGPLLVERILTNSITVAIGDSVRTTSGFAALSAASSRVLGHVEGLVGQDGLTPVKDGTFLGNIGGTYAVPANNQTVGQVKARIDVDKNSLYSADLNAAVGTTSTAGGSGAAGKYFVLSDEETLAESTFAETLFTLVEGTPNTITWRQYYSHGIDRNDTGNVMVNIAFSEVFGI